ncbi:MAG: hypothetical protein K8F30_09345, partial [Taibaiella sp.]|nr:hypothetical protein [Taibaiella sp.]
ISWRYCYFGGENNPGTQAWDYHKILGTFFTNAQVAEPPVPPDTTRSITTLDSASRGNVIRYESPTTLLGMSALIPPNLYHSNAVISGGKITGDPNVNPSIQYQSDLDGYMVNPPGIGGGDVTNELGMATFMRERLGILTMGDYLYINPGVDPHGLLVVGWGAIVDCPAVRGPNSPRLSIDDFASSASTDASLVPYVVDYTTAQWASPRPFYCTRWFTGDSPLIQTPPVVSPYYFGVHDWYFYTIPSQVTVVPSRLWVNSNWFWAAQDRTS